MPSCKTVISKEEADEIAIAYHPSAIDNQMSEGTKNFAERQKGTDFRLDTLVSQITGIDEIERQSRQEEIEQEALNKSQEIQEQAYKEAYDLGFEEGKKEAFDSEKQKIEDEISNLRYLIVEIKNMKMNLLKENKKHITQLTYYLAKRLMMKEIEENDDYIVDVIKRTLEMAQADEQLTIKISPDDAKFLLENRKEIFKELDLKEQTKVESDSSIERGGLILETNYGVIDATIEQRLEKLLELLSDGGAS